MPDKLITSIHVDKLFGMYTYRLPEKGVFSNAAILYGDNGVGKSTLLRLAFHLLSASNSRGHRTALYNSEFDNLEVTLASHVLLKAKIKNNNDQRILELEIVKNQKTLALWEYHPKFEPEEVVYNIDIDVAKNLYSFINSEIKNKSKKENVIPRGNKAYIEVLEKHVPTIFILNADRRLDSDSVSDPGDEMELRRVMRYEEPKRINELASRARQIALSQAMNSAGLWLSKKAVIGTNQGSMNVHSVYVDVLQHLISPLVNEQKSSDRINIQELVRQLDAIEEKTKELSKYELATELSTSEFKHTLNNCEDNKGNLAAELLKPYIKSLEGRLQALEPIYKIVDRFVTIVNTFLGDKSLSFKLSQGFVIRNKLGYVLSADQLSSGEQQLLLLLCYVLTARDMPSVFMIDEPEISLNIKWQRQLVQSLLDITDGANIQFIFASHSMELLSQHRNRVVKLVDK